MTEEIQDKVDYYKVPGQTIIVQTSRARNLRDDMYQSPDGNTYPLYNLVDMKGAGEMVRWMSYGIRAGDYSFIDGYMEGVIPDMTYNAGKGRLEPISELIKVRNKQRNERLGAFARKKGKGKSGPNILDNFDQDANQGDLKKALKLLDGGKGGKGDAKYREVVWRYDKRGYMGESLLGCCLMQGGFVHNQLAVRIVKMCPALVNDICISEDYYAIANDDPRMLLFLLNNGADLNQRCYGAFFCPDDQKDRRTDSLEHEYVDVPLETNYKNRMYFGEYPLAFAACLNQRDCFQILRARRADPNRQDTNGNGVLHMTVIHENLAMFELARHSGAKLHALNKQRLSPLTLAARMAKKTMLDHILKIESKILASYGDYLCVSYPLAKIDSIEPETGEMNDNSVLSLVVYGESSEHLALFDGLLEDLLKAKWRSFGLKRWCIELLRFVIYYIFVVCAFMSRPISETTSVLSNFALDSGMEPTNVTSLNQVNRTFRAYSRCHLLSYGAQGRTGYLRAFSEAVVYIMALSEVLMQVLYVRRITCRKWWTIMRAFPAKVLYFFSLLLVFALLPIRALCFVGDFALTLDNCVSLVCIVFCTLHFLFFCRAIKFIGPFVLMIYTIILRDLIRFMLIYGIFLAGFSQAFYIVFLAGERAYNDQYQAALDKWMRQNGGGLLAFGASDPPTRHKNIMSNPVESLVRLFIMTIGEFTVMYRELNAIPVTELAVMGKVLFITFELVVSLMQFNLLIAMMSRTYDLIYRTQQEYKRQWAQVILLEEMSLSAAERKAHLFAYSRPTGTDKRRRAFVVNTRRRVQSSQAERLLREGEEERIRLEKQQLLKRRLRHLRDGIPLRASATTPLTRNPKLN